MDSGNEAEYTTKQLPIGRFALASITKDAEGHIQFGCKECPVKSRDKEFLEHHLLQHYNQYRFLCSICGVGLKRREHLERHTQGHLEVRPHICPICDKAFKRKEHLNIHRSIHSGDKTMYCSICKKSFYRKDHLQKHIQTHSKVFVKNNKNVLDADGNAVEVKEEGNSIEFEVESILPDFEQESNSDGDIKMEIDESYGIRLQQAERPFACPVCGKAFKRRDHLKVHSFTHRKKENECHECGKGFHSPELLLDHVNRVHGTETAEAPEAPEAAEFPEDPDDLPLAVHSIIGTHLAPDFVTDNNLLLPRPPKPERPHECHICHRKFKRRQHLKVHANVHLRVEPTVWCSVCHVGFFDNYQFETHQCLGTDEPNGSEDAEDTEKPDINIQQARKENSFPIEFIEVEENIKIVDESNIVEPEEMHIPTPLRVYVCKYCSKPFKRKDHYRIHLNIHTGVKSFFCPHCDKGFYRKDHMKKHAQIHDKPKPQGKNKKQIPDLYPINTLPKMPKLQASPSDVKPEITIHAPSNSKLRVPLSIKVPYKMVMSLDNGEQRAVTVDPHAHH